MKKIYMLLGFLLIFPILPARATTISSGDLIKGDLASVYYYGADGKRYVFPNEKTYLSWYADFLSVKTVTDSELAVIQIGGNVTYRPGVKMVKIETDPKVYAVASGGTLRWIKTEALAEVLYGASWAKKVEDVPDAFFVNYKTGSEISQTTDFSPSSQTESNTSINVDKGLASSGGTTETTYVWNVKTVNADSYLHNNLELTSFNGGFLASWNDDRNGQQEIYYQKTNTDAAGTNDAVRVSGNVSTSNNARANYNGTNLYFLWEDSSLLKRAIYMQKRDNLGNKLSESIFASTTYATAENPDLAWNADLDEYGISRWDTKGSGIGSAGDLYFQRMTAGGLKTGNNLKVTSKTSAEFKPKIISAEKYFSIVWQSDDKVIKFAKIDSQSGLAGSVKDVYTNNESAEPKIAWSGSVFGIVWTEKKDGISQVYLGLLDENGTTIGNKITVASGGSEPDVIWAENKFYISYVKDADIYIAKSTANGNMPDAAKNISNSNAVSSSPKLSVNNSVVAAAWLEANESVDKIMGAVEKKQ